MLKEKLKYSEMRGTHYHCIAAQIFDSEGLSVARIDSRFGSRKANKYAKLMVASPTLLNACKIALRAIPVEDIEAFSIVENAMERLIHRT